MSNDPNDSTEGRKRPWSKWIAPRPDPNPATDGPGAYDTFDYGAGSIQSQVHRSPAGQEPLPPTGVVPIPPPGVVPLPHPPSPPPSTSAEVTTASPTQPPGASWPSALTAPGADADPFVSSAPRGHELSHDLLEDDPLTPDASPASDTLQLHKSALDMAARHAYEAGTGASSLVSFEDVEDDSDAENADGLDIPQTTSVDAAEVTGQQASETTTDLSDEDWYLSYVRKLDEEGVEDGHIDLHEDDRYEDRDGGHESEQDEEQEEDEEDQASQRKKRPLRFMESLGEKWDRLDMFPARDALPQGRLREPIGLVRKIGAGLGVLFITFALGVAVAASIGIVVAVLALVIRAAIG